jgi:hypothetical protein
MMHGQKNFQVIIFSDCDCYYGRKEIMITPTNCVGNKLLIQQLQNVSSVGTAHKVNIDKTYMHVEVVHRSMRDPNNALFVQSGTTEIVVAVGMYLKWNVLPRRVDDATTQVLLIVTLYKHAVLLLISTLTG